MLLAVDTPPQRGALKGAGPKVEREGNQRIELIVIERHLDQPQHGALGLRDIGVFSRSTSKCYTQTVAPSRARGLKRCIIDVEQPRDQLAPFRCLADGETKENCLLKQRAGV